MRHSLIASALLSLAWSSAGHAQTQLAQGDAAPKSADAAKTSPALRKETFGSWTLICATPPGASEESCEVDISLQPEDQLPPVAKVAFVRGTKGNPLRLVAIVQANLTLEPGVEIRSDPGQPGVVLKFKSCLNSACLADAELTEEQAQGFRSPTHTGQLTLKNAGGEQLSLPIPAKGLDEALSALAAAGK